MNARLELTASCRTQIHEEESISLAVDGLFRNRDALARMYERRLKGYAAIGYAIETEVSPPREPTVAKP